MNSYQQCNKQNSVYNFTLQKAIILLCKKTRGSLVAQKNAHNASASTFLDCFRDKRMRQQFHANGRTAIDKSLIYVRENLYRRGFAIRTCFSTIDGGKSRPIPDCTNSQPFCRRTNATDAPLPNSRPIGPFQPTAD